MMKTFFDWQEALGWRASLCFAIGLGLGLCLLILLVDIWIRKYAENAELRAIRERVWAEKQLRLEKLIEAQREHEAREAADAEFVRRLQIDVPRDDLQSRREARQFNIPAAFRDVKGTQR